MQMNFFKFFIICFTLLSLLPSSAFSQKNMAQTLAQQVQNPISSLTVVPFQDNTSYEFGDHGQAQNILNIQPAIPIKLNKNFNLPLSFTTHNIKETGKKSYMTTG